VGVDLLKRQLKDAFDMKDIGKLLYLLAIQVHPRSERSTPPNSPTRYTNISQTINMENSSPVFTPMATSTKLCK
jgi:hypothetical protein